MKCNIYFHLKSGLGPECNSVVLFFLSPGKMRIMSPVQEGLDIRNVTKVTLLVIPVACAPFTTTLFTSNDEN